LDAIAWHRGNSDGKIHPAGQKAPNGFRLYDMLGSVWEWVADWYGAKHYDASQPVDPQGPPEGEFRVVRGGSWINLPRFLRVSGRGGGRPGFRDYSRGFRCVRETAP
jgi:formylglycine-generating enzyme required for sulfatase activity